MHEKKPDLMAPLHWVFNAVCLALVAAMPLAADPAAECDRAARAAAEANEVPLDILRAITRTETGRGTALRPWPWTVNMEGKGVWFNSADQAKAYVFRHFKRGARSFDIGCFQINYRWHGQSFNSIDEMFDPAANASYAAQYLRRLRQEFGDWNKAVGAYHSRTHAHATRYLARYAEVRRTMPQTRAAFRPAGQSASHRRTLSGPGSLVPLGQTRGRGFLPRLGS